MQQSLKIFFIFSLLLIFLSNVSGISVCLEHSNHTSAGTADKKDRESRKGSSFSKDDQCQCSLHLQMNTCLFPEITDAGLLLYSLKIDGISHPKAIAHRCLIDFFSSRAPPCFLSSLNYFS